MALITIENNKVHIRYSRKKLKVLKLLYPKEDYKFISSVIRLMSKNDSVQSIEDVNYLSRYSNNLMSMSKLKDVDVPPTQKNKDWLFKNYIYSCKE